MEKLIVVVNKSSSVVGPVDARATATALCKHFPDAAFRAEERAGEWIVIADGHWKETFDEFAAFARGFLASRHLWER